VVLVASQCGDSAGVALTLHTRDSWTLRPTARLRTPASLALGMEERNFLGTARTIALNSEMTTHGSGAAFTLNDPWLLGTDVAANLRVASLAGTHTVRAGIRNHEYSVFDRWRLEAGVSRVTHGDTATSDRTLRTLGASASIGRRVGNEPYAATLLIVGVEFDSAAGVSASRRVAEPGIPTHEAFSAATWASRAAPRCSTPRAGWYRAAASSTSRSAGRAT
jgi:Outer membrane protein/protective antigen OMA87